MFVIIAEAVFCSHFEQIGAEITCKYGGIWRRDRKSGDFVSPSAPQAGGGGLRAESRDSPQNPETWRAWFTLMPVMELCCQADWKSDGVVVKLLLAEQEARDSIPNITTTMTTISEIGYLLLPSHNLAEISPKRRKSSKQQTRLEYNRQI